MARLRRRTPLDRGAPRRRPRGRRAGTSAKRLQSVGRCRARRAGRPGGVRQRRLSEPRTRASAASVPRHALVDPTLDPKGRPGWRHSGGRVLTKTDAAAGRRRLIGGSGTAGREARPNARAEALQILRLPFRIPGCDGGGGGAQKDAPCGPWARLGGRGHAPRRSSLLNDVSRPEVPAIAERRGRPPEGLAPFLQ